MGLFLGESVDTVLEVVGFQVKINNWVIDNICLSEDYIAKKINKICPTSL